jgi:uncharacterized protein (UPF0276 family)
LAASADLPAIGVGTTYSSAIEPLLWRDPGIVDVLEIEPQTTWIRTPGAQQPYRVNEEVLRHLLDLPGHKLVHSVGAPVGGTVRPEPGQVALLREVARRLSSPWLSEHLSFNQARGFATGFFLPPRQTLAGVETAVAAIRDLGAALPVPVAVETGVNYLRPRPDELPDGEFVARVVEGADCGILLDLHNVFANDRNGRQSLEAFLDQIPLERVWEVHLAGGFEDNGYYLDAHSGAIPDEVYRVAEALVPELPALGAIIFEIFPSFVPVVGLDLVREQLALTRELWNRRARRPATDAPVAPATPRVPVVWTASSQPVPGEGPMNAAASPEEWEEALGRVVTGQTVDSELGRALATDPAVPVIEGLIHEFRASMIVGLLPLTTRLFLLALGPGPLRTVLRDYWAATPPQMYASLEAEAFGRHLARLALPLPHLAKILEFERSGLATLVDEQPRVVAFDFEPLPLLRALAEGRLPDAPGEPGAYEIELTPDEPAPTGVAELASGSQRFH